MKLSVVTPAVGADLIPLISRFANSQNGVRPAIFSPTTHSSPDRRGLASDPRARVAGSQIQTHWYYERARGPAPERPGGHDQRQTESVPAVNPRSQVIRKTDLAKVELQLQPWSRMWPARARKRSSLSLRESRRNGQKSQNVRPTANDWFKAAVARVILFRATEAIVSNAAWYEAAIEHRSLRMHAPGSLSWHWIDREWWPRFPQGLDPTVAGPVLERKSSRSGKSWRMCCKTPPMSGQNISEWAKTTVLPQDGPGGARDRSKDLTIGIVGRDEHRANKRQQKSTGEIDVDSTR